MRTQAVPTWKARLPWALQVVTTVMVAAMVLLSLGHEPWFDTVFFGLTAITLTTLGALITTRLPANPIGWIFCIQGFWTGLLEMWGGGLAYHDVPTAGVGHWITEWWWVFDVAAYGLVLLLFPTGRLLTHRWRSVAWVLVAGVVVAGTTQGLTSRNADNPVPVESPVLDALVPAGMVLLVVGFAAAAASIVVRYQRAAGQERLQLKVLVFAAAAMIPSWALAVPFYNESSLVQAWDQLSYLVLPMAVGLAVLRYRLYDIDVVINRALVYGALTASLAAIYLASVLLLQLALRPFTEGSSLAIAVSTLAVAALFRPARARIQHAVDRRFFRRRYDAAQTLQRFGSHLRDQVDLTDIGTDLIGVVSQTVQPSHVSLWLPEHEAPR